ncbi:hypothetical protein LUZ60_010129 [Juncus effusus]|nr:hypothetical protein LUZ60_010129 [Juncus effusus]
MNMSVVINISIVIFAVLAVGAVAQGDWDTGHATFYGDMNPDKTMGAACGYGDVFEDGYGFETAALSTALFNNGQTCGTCYEIQCFNDTKWCASGSITITATNFCPPNPSKPNDDGGWCNSPLKHFDLSMPMFEKIVTDYHAGIVPVQFRRVTCVKKGGIHFEMSSKGNPNFILVLIYNVAGAGEVTDVKVKGKNTDWIPMSRNWGQNWQTGTQLVGQALSFQVTASDGKMVQADNVVPASWQFGQSFEGSAQF